VELEVLTTTTLLAISETRFASVVVMLKRMQAVKKGLLSMVINEQWSQYREDDVQKAAFVKETILSDQFWDQIDYILKFTDPIYDMLRSCDTDEPNLHLVYEKWDSMIEQVKSAIYKHEGKELSQHSSFYDVVYNILIDRWSKNNTPLHCMAYSLNPRYISIYFTFHFFVSFISPHICNIYFHIIIGIIVNNGLINLQIELPHIGTMKFVMKETNAYEITFRMQVKDGRQWLNLLNSQVLMKSLANLIHY
jgi:hypothetical protein